MPQIRLAISITAHERVDVLHDQVLNIVRFCRDPLVVLHLNADFARSIAADPDHGALLDLIRRMPQVRINPQHLPTRWAHMFHAHLSNFRLLLASGEPFSHVALLSSADLFFRAGVEAHLEELDAGTVASARFDLSAEEPAQDLWAQRLREDVLAVRMFRSLGLPDVVKDAHEGSFYRREVLLRLLAVLDRHIVDWEYDDRYTKEEFFLQNLVRSLSGLRVGRRITHVFGWGCTPTQDRAMLAAAMRWLALAPGSPAGRWAADIPETPPGLEGVYAFSRIPREADHPLRRLLTVGGQPHARAAVAAAFARLSPLDLLQFERPGRNGPSGGPLAGASPSLMAALEERPGITMLHGGLGAATPRQEVEFPACPHGYAPPARLTTPPPRMTACAAFLPGPARLVLLPAEDGLECAIHGDRGTAEPPPMVFLFAPLHGFDRDADWVALLDVAPREDGGASLLAARLWIEPHGEGVQGGQFQASPPLLSRRSDGLATLAFDLTPALPTLRARNLPTGWTAMAYLSLPVPLSPQRLRGWRLVRA